MVVELCLVFPVQTACCEQGNSCLNRIMTDYRASLIVSTVNPVIQIRIDWPSADEYDATKAVAE